MDKLIVTAIIILACTRLSYAQAPVVRDPELDFVSSASKMGGYQFLPPSEQIYRLDLDFYGNGKPTIFLTFKGWGGKAGRDWIAYTPVVGGYLRVVETSDRKQIIFRSDGFYSIDPKGGLYVLYPGQGSGDLVHYDIKNGAAEVKSMRFINYENKIDMNYISKILGHMPGEEVSSSRNEFKILETSEVESRKK